MATGKVNGKGSHRSNARRAGLVGTVAFIAFAYGALVQAHAAASVVNPTGVPDKEGQTQKPSDGAALSNLPAVAGAVELSGDAKRSKLVFTLSQPVTAKAFLLERPDRVIVDLSEVNFQLPAGSGRTGAGLVASYRYGLFARGRSRIVIDLKEPALVAKAVSTLDPSGQIAKLEIELTRTERGAYRQAALKPMVEAGDGLPPAPGAGKPLVLASAGAADKPLIVIDPGHGGVDTGAISPSGVAEKAIVFSFAERLKAKLEETGKYRIILTRTDDSFVTLPGRVRVAREAGAALFLSVHADILSASPKVRGATIYTGSKFATDAESAELADKENKADAVAGVDSQDDPEEVADILLDLTKRETRSFSGQFAKGLVSDLDGVVKLNKNPHRSAGFRVLKAPDIPSVLLEIGYLSSSQDADLMNSDEWRERSTAAITKAVDRYFAARSSRHADAAVSP